MEKATITRLEVENYKAIRAVRVVPGEGSVIVGGRNAQGKSSLLDSIMAALAGKAAIAERPVHEGAEQAEIRVTLSNGLVAQRTIRPDGSGKLVVKDSEGRTLQSPQSVIDQLALDLTFDPLAFSRRSSKEQLATLQKLLGLDFAAVDAERARVYDERTSVGREGQRLSGAVDTMPHYDDAPAEEVSVAAVAEELRAGEAAARLAAELTADAARGIAHAERKEAMLDEEIERFERSVRETRDEIARVREVAQTNATKAEEARAEVPDVEALRAKLAGADEANRKARANRDLMGKIAELQAVRDAYAALSVRIKALDEAKRATIAAAKFPLEGLSIGEDGLVYGGIPFSSASQAEKLRVSVAIGAALPSKLGIMLVREGALLDDESLVAFADQAQAAGVQAWIEVVGSRDGVGIVIEDGGVVGADVAEAAE